jgi:hypothetical protein
MDWNAIARKKAFDIMKEIFVQGNNDTKFCIPLLFQVHFVSDMKISNFL